MTTFPESKMTKMTLTKMTACYVFSELLLGRCYEQVVTSQ